MEASLGRHGSCPAPEENSFQSFRRDGWVAPRCLAWARPGHLHKPPTHGLLIMHRRPRQLPPADLLDPQEADLMARGAAVCYSTARRARPASPELARTWHISRRDRLPYLAHVRHHLGIGLLASLYKAARSAPQASNSPEVCTLRRSA